MDLAALATIMGPLGAALYGSVRFIGPKIVDAWERSEVAALAVEARKAVALEAVAKGQGDVLAELKIMNDRMAAVEGVIVDKRFSELGKKLERLERMQTNPNLAAALAADPPSDPPPADDAPEPHHALPPPASITLTIGVSQQGGAAPAVAAAPPSGALHPGAKP